MNVTAAERLIKALRAAGVTYFKSEEFEVRFGAVESQTKSPSGPAVSKTQEIPLQKSIDALQSTNVQKSAQANSGDVPVKEMKIPHQLNEMVSVLKMNDEELVNKLFPMEIPPEEALGMV